MEVAQIARSIARYLNLNEDLAECLSLAHDLGHTPCWSCWRRLFK
jgi:dGTP triphosphohydrolase